MTEIEKSSLHPHIFTTKTVLQPFGWYCVECAIHHKWDVHEE